MLNPEMLEIIFQEIGLTNMSDDEKARTMVSLESHFTDIVMETTIENFNDDQLQRFRYYMDKTTDPELLDRQVEALAAEVPGLADKIQHAIVQEVETLKSGAAALS